MRGRTWFFVSIAALCAAVLFAGRSRLHELREQVAFQWRIRPLVAAAGRMETRDIEPRLAGFPHRPLAARRGGRPVLAQLAAAAEASRGGGLHAQALAHLIAGADDKAVELFDRAIAGATDSRLLADAAAAYYVNATRREAQERLSDALAAANRAVAAEAGNAPAHFARALVLERLALREDARAAWERYLALDRSSLWAAEARARLARVAVRFREPPALVDDALTASVARETRAMALSRPSLSAALKIYEQAVGDYYGREIVAAERGLQAALRTFEEEDCPARFSTRVQLAGCRYFANDFRGALTVSARALQITPPQHHSVRGRLLWMSGLAHAVLGEAEASLRAYESAIGEFEAGADRAGISAVESLLAEQYEYLGQPDEAARHRLAALANAYDSGRIGRLASILSEAGSAAAKRGEKEVAMVVFERLVLTVRRTGDALDIVDALTAQAGLLASSGRRDEARRAFRDAMRESTRLKDANVRRRLHALIALRSAQAEISGEPSVPPLESAIAAFEASGDRFLLSDALLVRATRAVRRDDAAAERDLRRGLELIDGELQRISEPAARASYLGRRQAFFDQLVPLLMRRGEIAAAFDAADQAHHGLLSTYRGDALPAKAVSPVDVPPGTAIVSYFVAGEDVFAWTLDSRSLRGLRLSTPASALKRTVNELHEAIAARNATKTRALLRDVDARLLVPVHPDRPARLIVIPDRFLASVPFAALIGPDGDYRVADTPTGMDVSARRHLRARGIAEGGAPIVLAAAGVLPEAEKETAALSRLYADAEVLPATARGADLIAAIGTHRIAHIASHGYSDRRRPLRSGLRLSEAASVSALDLAAARYPSTRLVYLGACSTNAAADERTAVGNVSTALLAAGVPTTVGVLWDVPDASARAMAISFHTELRAGHSPHEALRSAQLRFIDIAPHDVLSWGGYVVNGAGDAGIEK